jgi:hypothetical protein
VQEKLWDPEAQFFKVLPRPKGTRRVDVREESGYTPWYFNLPDSRTRPPPGARLWIPMDSARLSGRRPPSSEARTSGISYEGHECQWNGPSWPYSTSITLTALANLLDNYDQSTVSRNDYFDLLKTYTKSQHSAA